MDVKVVTENIIYKREVYKKGDIIYGMNDDIASNLLSACKVEYLEEQPQNVSPRRSGTGRKYTVKDTSYRWRG